MIKNAFTALKNLILPKKAASQQQLKTLPQKDTKPSGTSAKPVTQATPKPSLPKVSYPVRGYKVTTGYGVWGKYWGSHINKDGEWVKGRINGLGMHKGYDLPTPVGTKVYAVASGKTLFSGNKGKLGLYIKQVIPGLGYAIYAHLSRVYLKKGSFVEHKQLIGETGKTGNTSGAHIHFEVRHKGNQPFEVEFI